jgi:hypothetical protein
MFAVTKSDAAIVTLLLEQGADVKLVDRVSLNHTVCKA